MACWGTYSASFENKFVSSLTTVNRHGIDNDEREFMHSWCNGNNSLRSWCFCNVFAACLRCPALPSSAKPPVMQAMVTRSSKTVRFMSKITTLHVASPFLEKITTFHVYHTLLVHFFAVTTAQLRREVPLYLLTRHLKTKTWTLVDKCSFFPLKTRNR